MRSWNSNFEFSIIFWQNRMRAIMKNIVSFRFSKHCRIIIIYFTDSSLLLSLKPMLFWYRLETLTQAFTLFDHLKWIRRIFEVFWAFSWQPLFEFNCCFRRNTFNIFQAILLFTMYLFNESSVELKHDFFG